MCFGGDQQVLSVGRDRSQWQQQQQQQQQPAFSTARLAPAAGTVCAGVLTHTG
jgi:hypothetical protein